MGADYFVGFYGIKIALSPDDEDTQEACALGTDPRSARAIAAGLETHVGRMTDGEDYFLYIGRIVASIGLQANPYVAHPLPSLVHIAQDVDARLQQAGFREKPALHFQLEAKY